jgi:hypothetical protein
MMRIFSAIFLVSLSVSNSADLNAPGKAVFWSLSGGRTSGANYQTQSFVTSQINGLFDNRAKASEIVALMKSADGRPILSHESVKESIRGSSDVTVLPNIYPSGIEEEEAILVKSASFENAKNIDLHAFIQILQEHESSSGAVGPMNNGVIDSYVISLSGHESDQEQMRTVAALSSKSTVATILFAAADEPMEKTAIPVKIGHYSRFLSTASSSNIDGIFYKPEGSEYSIYYADTYLYITPDIFTGLMTGIFVFFVLLTGYSCLGAIQGNSIYPSKMPVLGREA